MTKSSEKQWNFEGHESGTNFPRIFEDGIVLTRSKFRSNFQRAIRFFYSMVFNFRRVVLFRWLFKRCFISFSTTIDGCITVHFQVERSLDTTSTDVTQFVLSRVYAGGFHNSPACLVNLNKRKNLPRTGIESSLDKFAIAGCKRQWTVGCWLHHFL